MGTGSAHLNQFVAIAGEHAPDGGTSGYSRATMLPTPISPDNGTGLVNTDGIQSFKNRTVYDLERRRILIMGMPHPGIDSNSSVLFDRVTEYSVDTNLTTQHVPNPIGLTDARGYSQFPQVTSITGTPNSSIFAHGFIGCIQNVTTGGTGATWNVTVSGGAYHVNVNPLNSASFSGYAIGNVITIRGTQLGGTTPANDCSFTVSFLGHWGNGHAYDQVDWDSSTRTLYRGASNQADILAVQIDGPVTGIVDANWSLNPFPLLYSGIVADRGAVMKNPSRGALWKFNSASSEIWEMSLIPNSNWTLIQNVDGVAGRPLLYGDGCVFFYNHKRHSVMFGGGIDRLTDSINQKGFWEVTFNRDDPTTAGCTFRRLDDCPIQIVAYSGGGCGLAWYDPISGHLFVAMSNAVVGGSSNTLLGIYECNPDASPGSQWRHATELEATIPPLMGGPDYFSQSSVGVLPDQGLVLFTGYDTIYALRTTANDRCGHETGDGSLTNADYDTFAGVVKNEPFSDPARLRMIWDTSDAGVTAAMATAGYTNHNLNWLADGATLAGGGSNFRLPGKTGVHGIPTIETDSGKTWLKLPIPDGVGENMSYATLPLSAEWPVSALTQKFWIAPNSHYGRTLHIRFTLKASPGYWSSMWRKVTFNYQGFGAAHVASGSDILDLSDPTNGFAAYPPGTGINGIATNDFTQSFYRGRVFVVHYAPWAAVGSNGTGDLKFFKLGAAVDQYHCHVTEMDGTTPHLFAGTGNMQISVSGQGMLDGVNDASVDGFKIAVFNVTPPNYSYPSGVAGNQVFTNARPDGIAGRLTNSPNTYAYSTSALNAQPFTNDGALPFNTSGESDCYIRIEYLGTPHAQGFGTTNKRVQVWINQVGGNTLYTDWATCPGVYLDDDGSGFKVGLSDIELLMQHTYGDPTQSNGDQYFLFTNLIVSTEAIPKSSIGTSGITPPPPPVHKQPRFLFHRIP